MEIIKKGIMPNFKAEAKCERCRTVFAFEFTDYAFGGKEYVWCPLCGKAVYPNLSDKEYNRLMSKYC